MLYWLQFFVQFFVQICNQSLLRCFLFQIRMKLSVFFSSRSRRVPLIENKKVQVFRERKLHKVSLLCVGHLAASWLSLRSAVTRTTRKFINKSFFSSMLLVLSWETQKLSFHGYNKTINFTI